MRTLDFIWRCLWSCAKRTFSQVTPVLSAGLRAVPYALLDGAQLETHIARVRAGRRYEGHVLYFMHPAGAVIGLLKKKTVWYILCRITKEFLWAACVVSAEQFQR